mmetsp:Transcript_56136/g.119359  ORF Transcript_56136/g.119359 Transcript_56136/m.119359 type:complete len:712 (+) Transcript_56136:326-2461(+)
MAKNQSAPARPPGTEAMFSVTCNDVVLGRGSGTQNHCGNVTYRKLVYLNKELYATSSKFDKLKISKAIVAAVREFGGNFMQADDKRGGLYYDIGDKRAWDKTSQALREGQADIRARLAEEDPSGMSKVAEYKQVISEQTFFAYACKMLESLYHPTDGQDSGISACGQLCPHAKRRQTLNQMGANPMAIHQAMQSMAPPPLPPLQVGQTYVQHGGGHNNHSIIPTSSMHQPQGNMDPIQPLPTQRLPSLEPLPYNRDLFVNGIVSNAPAPVGNIVSQVANQAPAPGGNIDSFEPLPYYMSGPSNAKTTPGGSVVAEVTAPTYSSYSDYSDSLARTTETSDTTEVTAPAYSSYSDSLAQTTGTSLPTPDQNVQRSIEPLPYQNASGGLQKPERSLDRDQTSGSVFSLRKFCSEDLEMTSEEGKALMSQLNSEVDELIRRKSYGLIQIDTTYAFEDLVFEDDSMNFDDPKPKEIHAPPPPPSRTRRNRESSSSSSTGRVSRNSGMSKLSYKDDLSLMNMSILTLEERGESEFSIEPEESSLQEEHAPPKSIMKPSTRKSLRNGKTRVSFGGKNISLMSMDDHSFSQLVDSISDPDADHEEKRERERKLERRLSDGSTDSQLISRKMGFPLRPTVAQKFAECESYDKISTLSITEDLGPLSQRRSDFTKLAGEVESPPDGIKNSLRPSNMSISNMSGFASSTMSLGSDIDPELLS